MIVTGKGELAAFIAIYTDAKGWIENWLVEVEAAKFKTPQDIKNQYSSVSFLSDGVVIFNVKGNKYRLETIVAYGLSIVEVVWIGTHKEYDKRNKSR